VTPAVLTNGRGHRRFLSQYAVSYSQHQPYSTTTASRGSCQRYVHDQDETTPFRRGSLVKLHVRDRRSFKSASDFVLRLEVLEFGNSSEAQVQSKCTSLFLLILYNNSSSLPLYASVNMTHDCIAGELCRMPLARQRCELSRDHMS
jgi:hypothetical protein